MVQFKDITSSVIIYGLSEAEFSHVESPFSATGIQFVYCPHLMDFKTKVSGSTHIIALVVKWDSLCDEELVYFRSYRSQLMIIGRKEKNNQSLYGAYFCQEDECLITCLSAFKNKQMHPDLGKWMVKCASFLMPFHLTSGALIFSEKKKLLDPPDYRFYQMNLELEPFYGVMLMGVDFNKFRSEISIQLGLDAFLCEDFLLELLNQYTGVLTQPFMNDFRRPKVMIPQRFYGDVTRKLAQKVCLPFSTISDSEDLFQFSFCIIHTQRGEAFATPMLSSWDPVQSMGFL